MSINWEKYRQDFPNTKKSVYLDHAAGGPVPEPVRRNIERHLSENACEADFAWPKWMKRVETLRGRVAAFINAEPEEIAFIHSTSHGMNLIAEMIASQGRVLTNSDEFPSSTLPWIWRKADLVFQDSENSVLSVERIRDALTPEIKTILTSYVQYGTGFRQDLEAIGRMKAGRYLAVNATQAFGAMQIDFKKWNADFLCSNSYKWLMAGYGGGILAVRKPLLEKLQPGSVGWRSMRDADSMNNRRTDLLPGASRYEMGCPSFMTIEAVGSAVEYFDEIGMQNVEARILALTDYLIQRLREKDVKIASSLDPAHRSGIVIIETDDAQAIWRRLLGHQIFVSPRGKGIRVAPHFYNLPEEIDFFISKFLESRDAVRRQG